MRNRAFCICKNKGGRRAADQDVYFRYTDGTIPLRPKIPSRYLYVVAVQPVLCRTCSETPKTDFHITLLILWKSVCL